MRIRRFMKPLLALTGAILMPGAFEASAQSESWSFDRLDRLGDHPTTIVASPRVIETSVGKAIEFDGEDDALFVDVHPLGAWFHVAAVYDGREFRNYVNGVQEGATEIRFTPQRPGRSSVGVRFNKVNYFKGAIYAARFTRRALTPAEFLAVATPR
jgi:hypothetical protein